MSQDDDIHGTLATLIHLLEAAWYAQRRPAEVQEALDRAIPLAGLIKVFHDDLVPPGYIVVTPEQAERIEADKRGVAA